MSSEKSLLCLYEGFRNDYGCLQLQRLPIISLFDLPGGRIP